MSSINEVVELTIEQGTKTVSRQSFGTPLILGSNCASFGSDKIRTYFDLDAVAEDFAETTREYKIANAIFGQDIRPSYLKIGKVGVAVKMKVEITPEVSNDFTYSITVNGVKYSYTSDGTATAGEIVTGLVAAIGADTTLTVTDATTKLSIEAKVAGIDFTIENAVNSKLSVLSVDEFSTSAVTALQEIKDIDTDFYYVLMTSRSADDITAMAAYIETQVMLFFATSIDTDIEAAVTTDVVSVLKALNYDRTVMLHSLKSENYLAAAYVSIMAPKDPGSATWKFKTGSGITAAKYSDTIRTRIKGKNCNIYNTFAGVDIFEDGKVISGEFIDIIQGTDWIRVNIQADVYSNFVNSDKVPYTNAGIDAVKSLVLAVLKKAIALGILAADPTPTVTAPDVSTISAADKAARVLPDVAFGATYSGAVHKVKMKGKLIV